MGNAWPAIVRSPGTAAGVLIGRAADDGALVLLDIADRAMKNRLIDVFGGSGQGKSFFAQAASGAPGGTPAWSPCSSARSCPT